MKTDAARIDDPQARSTLDAETRYHFHAFPVKSWFISGLGGPGEQRLAMTSIPGNDVYFLVGGLFGASGITPAVVFHEGLHIATQLGDPALAAKLGIPTSANPSDLSYYFAWC